MPSAGRQTQRGSCTAPGTLTAGQGGWLPFVSLLFLFSSPQGTAWPHDYRHLYDRCPGPEWSVMCRGCCEYDVIRCKCPLLGTAVGYAVPCCRNAVEECDPCIIHPGCSIFDNCKRCNNGTWGPRDDFFISGKYCSECRPGWSGGDCRKCGGFIRKRQGHLVLESYPNNARCEWTIQVDRPFTIELRFMMLSLEFHPSCRYDYVEVRDGDSVNSRVIARLCGNSRPAPITSSGSSLHVLFVSDGYKNFDGFFATFQENSACSSSPCLHDGTCVLDSSHAYHCACLGGYTGKRCENVVGCRRPPVPAHGSTEGLFLHSGARIAFRCDPGFELRGFPTAVCLSDGTWSAPAPECVPVMRSCTLPPKPAHGDHFLVYGPNDVIIALQYLCYQPYELSGNAQRTCLPNNTWSGPRPVCTTVNNTITEADTDTDEETETHRHKHIITAGEDGHENAEEEEATTRSNSTTGSDREDEIAPEETASEGGNEGEPEERNPGSDGDKVDVKDPDNSLDAVGRSEPENKHGSEDAKRETGRTDTGETVRMTDKGQEEKERKEEQVNGDRDQDGVGPNDTKLRLVIAEGENTVEIFELGMKRNRSLPHGAPETKNENVNPASPEQVRIIPAGANVTQHTVYRAEEGGESGKPRGKQPVRKDERNSVEEAKKEEEKERERESNQSFSGGSCPPIGRLYHGFHQLVEGAEPQVVEFFCDPSYALSGATRRTCRPDGTWSGKQPLCVRACREPKVSELVKQRVLPPQTPSRKTPVHKLFSSGRGRHFRSDGPTTGPSVVSQLPQGFHHLYTHIEYECASPFYQHFGSSRRTCLKTGKWSGRHVSCSPVCGKHPTFDPERPAESHWPWLAAVYRRSTDGAGTKVTKAGSLKRGTGDWQLVCSGALVNQRTVVVAAHCVSQLGKVYPLDPAEIKVVVGKHYRDDGRDSKGLQHLRVATISVHENYDPHVLDSDVAVVKLLDKAKIGEKVLPLCLSDGQEEEGASGRALVTGWSPLPDSGSGPGEKARVGLVQLAHIVPCEQQYARNGVPIGVTDNMLCAGQKPDYGPSNICPSDTGGILVLPPLSEEEVRGENKGLWRLLGLVSFGYDQGECDPELYTVYADVARFKAWIESSMK